MKLASLSLGLIIAATSAALAQPPAAAPAAPPAPPALTPPALLGRVSALFMVASFGARPIGAAIGGLIGENFGLDMAMAVAAIGFSLQFLIVLVSPIPALRRLPGV